MHFCIQDLNALLHSNELSDHLDVTRKSSKIVKLDITWSRRPKEMKSNKDHAVYLDLHRSTWKYKPEGYCITTTLFVYNMSGVQGAYKTKPETWPHHEARSIPPPTAPILLWSHSRLPSEIEVSHRCALHQHSCNPLWPPVPMKLLQRLRCTSAVQRLTVPASPIWLFRPLRSRWTSSRHCPSTPARVPAPSALIPSLCQHWIPIVAHESALRSHCSSQIVKLAVTWVATTRCDENKYRSCSLLFNSKRKLQGRRIPLSLLVACLLNRWQRTNS